MAGRLVLFGAVAGCGALIFALFLFSAVPTSLSDLESADYLDLSGLPDLSGFGSWGNLTGVPVVDLSHGLVLWLPFDGNVLDKSGYGCDGLLVGDSCFVDGVFSKCLLLDGDNDYVRVGSFDVFNGSVGSFSLWVNVSVVSSENCFFVWFVDWNNYFFSFLDSGGDLRCRFRLSAVTYDYTFQTNVTAGFWHSIIVTQNSTRLSCYFDGVFLKSQSCNYWFGDFSSLVHFDIGCIEGYSDLNGCLDDLRVYNRVLSAYEIEALFGLGV